MAADKEIEVAVLDAKLQALDRFFDSQIRAIHSNVTKAAEQIDKRLEGMNEFRDTLRDQAGRLATKDALRAAEDAADRRLKLLELRDAKLAGMSAVIAIVVSALIALIARFV